MKSVIEVLSNNITKLEKRKQENIKTEKHIRSEFFEMLKDSFKTDIILDFVKTQHIYTAVPLMYFDEDGGIEIPLDCKNSMEVYKYVEQDINTDGKEKEFLKSVSEIANKLKDELSTNNLLSLLFSDAMSLLLFSDGDIRLEND